MPAPEVTPPLELRLIVPRDAAGVVDGMIPSMGESEAVSASDGPRTRDSLAGELRALGVRRDGVLLVHSSLSALGWVCGGAVAVVQALIDVLGPRGTLVVPTHTGENSEPSVWRHPPVPRDWWPQIREHMPAYDARVTPSRGVGTIPEVVRTWPGALRSDHPQTSFAALGPRATVVTRDHRLGSALGERSPLARLYDLDADVLLLGAGHDSNTSMHLAEYRRRVPRRGRSGAAVAGPHGRRWVTCDDIDPDDGDFAAIGAAFDAAGLTRAGAVGSARCRLMGQRAVVDFALEWMERERAG